MGPESPVPAAKKSDRYYVWTALLITAISYLGVLRFGFVYDDDQQILVNPFIKSWSYVPQYFWTSVWNFDPAARTIYFRPMFLLWVRLNYAIFHFRPLGWHMTAILLHLLVTWLVFQIVRKLTGSARIGWVSALVFGTHPIHHEVVAWISGTTESLFAAFFLLSFLAYLQSRGSANKIWMFASYGCYALALLSKETALVLPALVLTHAWLAGKSESGEEGSEKTSGLKPAMGYLAFYVPIVLGYLLLRYRALSGLSHTQPGVTLSMWLLTLPSVLFFYLQNWFYPVRLSEMYDVFYQTHLNFAHVVLPALILLLAAFGIWRFRKELGAREVGIAAALILLPLLPALDTFVFKLDELVHDRYFYVPSIGAALLVALAIERFGGGRAVAFGLPIRSGLIIAVITAALGFCTAQQTRFWSDNLTLFLRAHEIAPQNSTAINNLGVEYLKNDQVDKAQAMLETGYKSYHDDFRYPFNLGRVHYVKRQLDQAEDYARQAIALNPNLADSYISLGQIELKGNRPAEALKNVRHAVELNPYNAQFHTVYGIVLEVNGDCPAAIPQFEDALSLNPGEGLTQREIFRCRGVVASGGSGSAPPKP